MSSPIFGEELLDQGLKELSMCIWTCVKLICINTKVRIIRNLEDLELLGLVMEGKLIDMLEISIGEIFGLIMKGLIRKGS